MRQYKMFGFVKQISISAMMFLKQIFANLSNANPLKCVSMSNQECKIRPEMVNVNNDEHTFYPYSL